MASHSVGVLKNEIGHIVHNRISFNTINEVNVTKDIYKRI